MAATLFPTIFLATSGIVFAFENSTLPGRLILLSLFFASIFSWAVMVTKFRVIRHAKRRREQFLTIRHHPADLVPLVFQEAGQASVAVVSQNVFNQQNSGHCDFP